MPKHLVIACGGTGGHFYPSLAIAQRFVQEGHRATLLLAGRHTETQQQTAAKCGLDSVVVPAVRLPGTFKEKLLFFPRLLNCVWRSRQALRLLRPDVLLGMGSFAAVPACMALPRSIPMTLHEGNAHMGKANRLFARRAAAIGLSLPLAAAPAGRQLKTTTVGMPLREALLKAAGKPAPPDFLVSLGLQPDRQTVLVFGGSQGARFINELFTGTAPLLSAEDAARLQFIHLTGTEDNAALTQAYRQAGIPVSIRASDPNIESCYQVADLVVCRGGASSICELALFAKPAILIPLPSAADDHQTVNAEMVHGADAACHFPQRQATPKDMAEKLASWLANQADWQQMGERLHTAFAKPDAAAEMVRLILTTISQ